MICLFLNFFSLFFSFISKYNHYSFLLMPLASNTTNIEIKHFWSNKNISIFNKQLVLLKNLFKYRLLFINFDIFDRINCLMVFNILVLKEHIFEGIVAKYSLIPFFWHKFFHNAYRYFDIFIKENFPIFYDLLSFKRL